MEKYKHKELLSKAFNIKKRFLAMYKGANAGHIGSSLSCAEILTFVRFGWMNNDDEIVLSKGHAAAAFYSMLAEEGILSDDDIKTFYKNNTLLPAHPPTGKIKRIPFATGSLGHGLSLAAGFGLAGRFKKINKQIFCITSDGELNEGSTWEAALFIVHHNLKNVVWLIDRNRIQGFGRTEEVMHLNPLDKKLAAWGFYIITCNGHNFDSLSEAKILAENSGKPAVLICNTIKGYGWKLYEDKLDCHYLPLKDDQFDLVNREIESEYSNALKRLSRK